MSDQDYEKLARQAAEARRQRALREGNQVQGKKELSLEQQVAIKAAERRVALAKAEQRRRAAVTSGMSDADLIALLEAEAMAGTGGKSQSPTTDGPWTRYADDRGQQTGMVGQTMSGVNEGIAGILGAPVDLMTGAINMGKQGVNALAGTYVP